MISKRRINWAPPQMFLNESLLATTWTLSTSTPTCSMRNAASWRSSRCTSMSASARSRRLSIRYRNIACHLMCLHSATMPYFAAFCVTPDLPYVSSSRWRSFVVTWESRARSWRQRTLLPMTSWRRWSKTSRRQKRRRYRRRNFTLRTLWKD